MENSNEKSIEDEKNGEENDFAKSFAEKIYRGTENRTINTLLDYSCALTEALDEYAKKRGVELTVIDYPNIGWPEANGSLSIDEIDIGSFEHIEIPDTSKQGIKINFNLELLKKAISPYLEAIDKQV